MSSRLKFATSLCSGLLLLALPSVAQAVEENDVVRHSTDNQQGIVVNTFNNCVRTKWQSGSDACAPAAPAKPVPYVSRARQLKTEERTVYFEFNHSEIVQKEQGKLNSLADVLKSDKSVRGVKIVGYADRIGSVSYNDHLSQLRAQGVEKYLRDHGYLKTERTDTRWLGKSAPKTKCGNKMKRPELIACLAQDRRVEVEIEYTDTK